MVYIENSNDFDQLLRDNERLLVDFYADWCGPCQMMAPVLEELAAENDEATIVKVDIEAVPQMSTRYNVSSIPTFITLVSGEIRERFVGVQEKAVLTKSLK